LASEAWCLHSLCRSSSIDHWVENVHEDECFRTELPGDYHVFSIPQRLTAHPRYTGEGVTICFIDSGFYFHPDLCEPENRIVKAFDIHKPDSAYDGLQLNPQNWHGTMTSVVGASNGWLSGGQTHHPFPIIFTPLVDYKAANIRFQCHQEAIENIAASGGFNAWQQPGVYLQPIQNDLWEITIPLPEPGVYPYKFLIDNTYWQADTRNLYRSPDGLGGFNSLLIIEQEYSRH